MQHSLSSSGRGDIIFQPPFADDVKKFEYANEVGLPGTVWTDYDVDWP